MNRLGALICVVLIAVMASACRVETTVNVVAEEDGSGEVSVLFVADAEAVALAPDLPDELRIDDLEAAGWAITGPDSTEGGGMRVAATKPFESADQLPIVLAEIAGDGVIFRNIALTQSRSFARTTYKVTGTVDPAPPIESFSDDDITLLLEGMALGRTVEDLEAEIGPFSESFGLIFSVTLPDDITSSTAEIEGRRATWTFNYGDAPLDLDATGTVEDNIPRLWLAVSLAALGLLLLVLLLRSVRWGLAILRTPKGRRRRDARRRQQRAATREAEASRPRRRLLRLLVVDVHGVIVRPTEPVEGLLLPVIQAERPDIDPEVVRDRHHKLILGRLTPEEFWSDIGLGPIASEVETRYLSSYRLVPGLHPFLDRMRERRLPVAVVGNQPRQWGERLRRMASLEDSVASWLVSGDVGGSLPEPSLFEATRRMLSVDLYDCLYLSSVPEYLDAAAEMGMATAYFAASPSDVLQTPHTLVRGFDDLLRGRGGGG